MTRTTLVVMAAGIGSRFGGGIKQLAPVGPGGEIIMDYSVYDAMEAGFSDAVFIIRHDLERDFREVIGNRIERFVPVRYVFQELDDLPEGFRLPAERTKPWGTGQAVLTIKGVVDNPFVVINSDDYYGKEAFVRLHDYLVEGADSAGNSGRPGSREVYDICMAGFILKNTLSENGGVTRGVCRVDGENFLEDVEETYEIQYRDGRLSGQDNKGNLRRVQEDQYVSMNMWGLYPRFLDELESGFRAFLSGLSPEDIKAEYLLPNIINRLLHEKRAKVKLMETGDRWFGVTYQEDRQSVTDAIHKLVEQGVYREGLFR